MHTRPLRPRRRVARPFQLWRWDELTPASMSKVQHDGLIVIAATSNKPARTCLLSRLQAGHDERLHHICVVDHREHELRRGCHLSVDETLALRDANLVAAAFRQFDVDDELV